MSTSWRDDDEELRVGGAKGVLRSKPRFSFTEVRVLLEAVKKNRCIVLRKFNQGVSAETKKQTWIEITDQINSLGENHREVRQIMKKWADLKCDGRRRIAALRGPNGSTVRKKNLGPVEKMVHKILMMSPRGDGDSDLDLADNDDLSTLYSKGTLSNPPPYSYLSLTDNSHSLPGGASLDLSPLSSPEKELTDPFHSSSDFDFAEDGERTMDFDENYDSLFSSPLPPSSTSLDPLPDDALTRVRPVHTYSRNNCQNHNNSAPRPPAGTSSSLVFPLMTDSEAPPLSQSPASSNATSSSLPAASSFSATAKDTTSQPAASSSILPPPPRSTTLPYSSGASVTSAPSSSVPAASSQQPSASSSVVRPHPHPLTSDPLPAGASFQRPHDQVAQIASQSFQQQRASRMLLTSVSQSLEILAQSVQLLVETQQEFVQESLLLQRETVEILRDFSNTALAMLRDKANSGHLPTHHHHPPSRF